MLRGMLLRCSVACTQVLRVWLTYNVTDAVASVVMADAACVVDV